MLQYKSTIHVRVGTMHSASWLVMRIRLSGEPLAVCEKTVPLQPPRCCEMTEVSVPRNGFDDRPNTSKTGFATCVKTARMAERHFSDTNRNRPQHSVEINSLMNGSRRLMFAIEIQINYLFIY